MIQHVPSYNLKILTEKHNDEKLAIIVLIVGTGLIAYHFWWKLLFTIRGAVVNALALSGTNFFFCRLTDHGTEERKRHDLAFEKLQRERDKWNRDRIKRLDFMNKRLREKNKARAYINNIDEPMLEYYQVFAKQIKPLPPEHGLSDFYHPSETKKNGELLFFVVGTGIATCALYKNLK